MMAIKILVTVFVLFVKHSTGAEQGHQSKRLLMNDPDHVETLLHQMQVEIQNLKSKVETQEKQIHTLQTSPGQGSGATYVRWGRKECPGNNTELVYSGYAAGGYYNEEGSAAEYICLSPDPNLGATWSDSHYGSIYGAEYESDGFGGGLWNDDVPCAVCRSTTASHTLMIAAKNQCYDGWSTEYVGELAGGHHLHKAASSFVCVDKNPDEIIGGEAGQDGKLFYPIKTVCGSLKCPPYHNNRLLPCVVCSR
ncbi:short-chain collagen C4-like isoform X1 [Mytilus galloprovincialis]|uniref:short-chain collagen C4-like isoform X1 n=1 Tax=Mytilus galloprovincialis TaxID=29158 RepID=UPI003F7BE634